jgi:membrane protease YdiL (CAAX protease family)
MLIYLLLLIVLIAYYLFIGLSPWLLLYIPNHANESSVEIKVLLGISVAFVFVLFTSFVSKKFAWAQRLNAEFAPIFRHKSTTEITLLALSSSLVEEVIFRGWLQQEYGILISAVIFGSLHIPLKKSHIPWTISALFMGFVFALMFQYTGDLIAVFIAHFSINYFNIHALKKQSMSS